LRVLLGPVCALADRLAREKVVKVKIGCQIGLGSAIDLFDLDPAVKKYSRTGCALEVSKEVGIPPFTRDRNIAPARFSAHAVPTEPHHSKDNR